MQENNNQLNWLKFNAIETSQIHFKKDEEKYNEFKTRLEKFEEITTLDEAKDLSKKILPVAKDFNKFKIGNATCIIINRDDMFRVSLDSEKEFICYDFI